MPIRRKIISTPKAPGAIGPYSQAVMVNRIIYISGQLGLDPATSELVAGGVVPQTRQAFKNVHEILTKAKSDFKDVIQVRVLLQDIGDFAVVNSEYAKYFKSSMPARAAFQVAALPKGGLIEIEVVASLGICDSGTIFDILKPSISF